MYLESYTAHIAHYNIKPNTKTDSGYCVKDLEPIGDCVLSPGDPSPVGRTPDGDLAYIVDPNNIMVNMNAHNIAILIQNLAKANNIKTIDDLNPNIPIHKIIQSFLREALNPAFFDDSAHAQMALKTARQNILTQGPKALPEFLS